MVNDDIDASSLSPFVVQEKVEDDIDNHRGVICRRYNSVGMLENNNQMREEEEEDTPADDDYQIFGEKEGLYQQREIDMLVVAGTPNSQLDEYILDNKLPRPQYL